jgi:hypothetical protein
MKRIAVLTLTLVLVLGSISVGLAKWFDTVAVEGTVSTANVDLVITGYSGTWVYKIYNANNSGIVQTADTYLFGSETVVTHDPNFLRTGQGSTLDISAGFDNNGIPLNNGSDGFLVAEAYATAGNVHNEVDITFTNIFPLEYNQINYPFRATVDIHYVGSIPAKIKPVTLQGIDGFGQQLIDGGCITISNVGSAGEGIIAATGRIDGRDLTEGFQLHNGDTFTMAIQVQLPQDDIYSAQNGSFKSTLVVSQYNEIS